MRRGRQIISREAVMNKSEEHRGMRFLDLAGNKFGKLVVIWPVGRDRSRRVLWLCLCDCGALTRVSASRLISRTLPGCACNKGRRTHAMSHSVEYKAYRDAKGRCRNPKHDEWERYGGRGIKFLFLSFSQFYQELGKRPNGLTLDRINNDGHYEPGNVRWASRKEQSNNQRRSICQ